MIIHTRTCDCCGGIGLVTEYISVEELEHRRVIDALERYRDYRADAIKALQNSDALFNHYKIKANNARAHWLAMAEHFNLRFGK